MEESHEIFDVADFWLETLFHLARESAANHPEPCTGAARKRMRIYLGRWRERTLGDHARAVVLNAAERIDRKLVLMVENLQTLCGSVDDDFGWQLRAALQSEPQIMMLASATSRFEGMEDAEEPFFELFWVIDLTPLTTEECRRLWQTVSGDQVSARDIRPLEILTGGNPRPAGGGSRLRRASLASCIDGRAGTPGSTNTPSTSEAIWKLCRRASGASISRSWTSGSRRAPARSPSAPAWTFGWSRPCSGVWLIAEW